MKDLKEALINKNTIKRAHTGEFLADAKNFKLSELKEGYILIARNGDLYAYFPVYDVRELFTTKLRSVKSEHVFVRYKGGEGYTYMDEASYLDFPHNKYSSDRDFISVYTNEKFNGKDTYSIDKVEKYLKNLPTIIATIK